MLLLSIFIGSCNGLGKTERLSSDPDVSLNQPKTMQARLTEVNTPGLETLLKISKLIRCIFQDKSGICWFGTEGLGVCRYEPATGGCNGGGVCRYDPATAELSNFTAEKGLSNEDFLVNSKVTDKSGTLARVWTIAEDNAGNLWFGTIDSGTWRYDGQTLTNFTVKDGLPSDAILFIFEDKAGKLWFGTDGEGVCKFDGKYFPELHKK